MDYRKGAVGLPFQRDYDNDVLAFKMAQLMIPHLCGCNHIWGFRDKFGTIGVYPRDSQPCQGGEMRKYENHFDGTELHGSLCTEEKVKPGDLFAPFPSGIPVFVGRQIECPLKNIKEFFGEGSIYGDLLGHKNFHFNAEGDTCRGFITTDTKVNPTVLVNAFQMVTRARSSPSDTLAGYPFDVRFLLDIFTLMSGDKLRYWRQPGEGYHFTYALDLERFVLRNPNDYHDGKTLFDGQDYNRTNVHKLFEVSRGQSPFKIEGNLTLKDFADKLVSAIDQIKGKKPVEIETKKTETVIEELAA